MITLLKPYDLLPHRLWVLILAYIPNCQDINKLFYTTTTSEDQLAQVAHKAFSIRATNIATTKPLQVKYDPITKSYTSTHLRCLVLDGNHLTSIEFLLRLTKITHLSIANCNLRSIDPIKRMINLAYLNAPGNRIRNVDALSDMKDLVFASLIRNRIGNIDSIRGCKRLQYLDLSGNCGSLGVLEYPELRTFKVFRGQLDGLILNCPKLTKFEYQHCYCNMTAFAKNTALTRLVASHAYINDLTPIQSMTMLTELDISGNRINDITPLQLLTNLTDLDLSWNYNITDLSALGNMTELRELDVSYNKLRSIDSLVPLLKLTKLEKVTLGVNGVLRDPGLVRLVQSLIDRNPNLRSLSPTLPQIKCVAKCTTVIDVVIGLANEYSHLASHELIGHVKWYESYSMDHHRFINVIKYDDAKALVLAKINDVTDADVKAQLMHRVAHVDVCKFKIFSDDEDASVDKQSLVNVLDGHLGYRVKSAHDGS
ncbi:Hypothetical protein MVR_LOCUS421 [uncultured virus]|nr:Hypothetical protein MVR_LOCUS421 [uncultured virus]